VLLGVEVVLVDAFHPTVAADQEGGAARDLEQRPLDAVARQDAALRVADERVRQLERTPELVARRLLVAGDADDGDAALLELRVLPAEPAGLAGSAGRERLGEEEDDRLAPLEQPVQRRVADREIGRGIAFREHRADDRRVARRRQATAH
jgi:hypothetical protein